MNTKMISLRRGFLTLKQWLFPEATPINKKDPRYILHKLYATVDAVRVSHTERDRLEIKDTSFVYGEITPEGFSEMLKVVAPTPHDIFYDLGSGSGKAVICAALYYDWKKCVGIELLPGLYALSLAQQKQLLDLEEIKQFYSDKAFPLTFICDDMLKVNFADADVIFVNATTFNAMFWGQLEQRFEALKPGTRLMISTRKLNDVHFELIHQAQYPMSWDDCTVFMYRKK